MPPLKIVLDTNALLRSISRRSAFAIILDKLYENAYELYITNDIQLEYEEKITGIFSKETAKQVSQLQITQTLSWTEGSG